MADNVDTIVGKRRESGREFGIFNRVGLNWLLFFLSEASTTPSGVILRQGCTRKSGGDGIAVGQAGRK